MNTLNEFSIFYNRCPRIEDLRFMETMGNQVIKKVFQKTTLLSVINPRENINLVTLKDQLLVKQKSQIS